MRVILLLSFGIFLIACGTSKKTHTVPKQVEDKDNKSEEVTEVLEIDTIYWTEIDRSEEYESAIEELVMNKKESYKLSLLYPFELSKNNINDINKSETKLGRMTHFYAGTLMALEQLESEGLNIELDIMDAESGSFDNKLQSCKNSDLIIGPRNSDQLAVVANFGKINNITVVSPWKSGSRISNDNPYFIQLKTGLREHFQKLVEHAKSEFSDEHIYIIGRKDKREDLSYMRFLQSIAAAMNNDGNENPLKQFYVSEDSLIVGETAFDSIVSPGIRNCVIMPNWSFTTDEDFVYNVARKLSGEKGLEDVTLYGMPILYESEKVKFELYKSLQMRICRSSYVDKTSEAVQEFRKKYFDVYKDFPSDEAYEAYDMMIFLGRNLNNYGTSFQYFLDNYESSLLQTKYDIQKVYDENDGDKFDNIQYFQNKHLYILSFEEDRFVPR